MALPVDQPVTVPDVEKLSYVGDDLEADDAERLERIVNAVNAFLRGLPIADQVDGQDTWPASITEGGVMLAGRLFRRKDTPGGVTTLGDGGVVYVRRNDPDVALLLELGEHSRPAVG